MKFRLLCEQLDSRDLPSTTSYLPPTDPAPSEPTVVLIGADPIDSTNPDTTPAPAPNAADPRIQAEIDQLDAAEKAIREVITRLNTERQVWLTTRTVQVNAVAIEQRALDAAKASVARVVADLKTYETNNVTNKNTPGYREEVARLTQIVVDANAAVTFTSASLARQQAQLGNITQRITFIKGLITQFEAQQTAILKRIGKLTLDQGAGNPYDGTPYQQPVVDWGVINDPAFKDYNSPLDPKVYPASVPIK